MTNIKKNFNRHKKNFKTRDIDIKNFIKLSLGVE